MMQKSFKISLILSVSLQMQLHVLILLFNAKKQQLIYSQKAYSWQWILHKTENVPQKKVDEMNHILFITQ